MSLLYKVKIKDLGKVFTGSTPLTKDETMWGGKHFFVKPSDLVKGSRRVFDTEKKLSDAATKTAKGRLLPAGTTCVVTIGTIGKLCQLDKPSATNQQINSIVVDKEKFDADYIYYLMSQSIDRVKVVEGGSASGREHVKKSTFEEIELEVLPLSQQVKLSKLVSKYDNLIENNNRRIAILEDMAQSLYREWFIKFRYPGHADNLDAYSPNALNENQGKPKLTDSPLGQIPEGWEVKRIKDLGTVNTGKTPSKKKPEYYNSADIPFLKTPDMHGAIFSVDIEDYLSIEGANSQKNKFVPANSVCVSCIGARAGVVTITSEKLQTNQQINSVVLDDLRFREYFYLFAVSLHQKIHALGSSGATMTNVNKSKFEGIEVIVPPEDVIQAFNSVTASSFDLILNLQKRNKNLKKQRDLLLPKLISGQIELKD